MELTFYKLSDHSKVHLGTYVNNYLSDKKNTKVYIGTDSQNHRRTSVFATVVVFHHGNNGGHVLYSKVTVPKMKTMLQRLWKEVELSVECAEYIKNHTGIRANFIDLDLNPDEKFASNSVVRSAVGWIESLGYESRVKHFQPYATVMANNLCR